MAQIVQEITEINASPHMDAMRALARQIDELPTKQAVLSFDASTYKAEVVALRLAVREIGYSLIRLRSYPETTENGSTSVAYKLGRLIERAPRAPKAKGKTKTESSENAETQE